MSKDKSDKPNKTRTKHDRGKKTFLWGEHPDDTNYVTHCPTTDPRPTDDEPPREDNK